MAISAPPDPTPVSREEFEGLRNQIAELVVFLKEQSKNTQGQTMPTQLESFIPGGSQGIGKKMETQIPKPHSNKGTNKTPEITKLRDDRETGDIKKKVQQMEETIRSIKGIGNYGSVTYSDLCIFPGARYLDKFKIPEFEKYNGADDPYTHLKVYIGELRSYA